MFLVFWKKKYVVINLDIFGFLKKKIMLWLSKIDVSLWHKRLGHASLSQVFLVLNLEKVIMDQVYVCILGTTEKLLFPHQKYVSFDPSDLSIFWCTWSITYNFIYLDWQFMSIYLVDYYTRYTWIHILKHKSFQEIGKKQFIATQELELT